MKNLFRLTLLSLLSLASSCAFFNDRTVDVSINSSPTGADIFIEGRNYGKTPATINIEPNNYAVTLTKEGYGSAVFNTESWAAVRSDTSGNTTGDGKRCLLDTLSVVFFFNAFTTKCADFKQKEYFINIPRLSSATGGFEGGSMIGVGNNPSNMINYYYGQDAMQNSGAATNSSANPYRISQ